MEPPNTDTARITPHPCEPSFLPPPIAELDRTPDLERPYRLRRLSRRAGRPVGISFAHHPTNHTRCSARPAARAGMEGNSQRAAQKPHEGRRARGQTAGEPVRSRNHPGHAHSGHRRHGRHRDWGHSLASRSREALAKAAIHAPTGAVTEIPASSGRSLPAASISSESLTLHDSGGIPLAQRKAGRRWGHSPIRQARGGFYTRCEVISTQLRSEFTPEPALRASVRRRRAGPRGLQRRPEQPRPQEPGPASAAS